MPSQRQPNATPDRYEFGANWASFIERNYSAARRNAAGKHLMGFLGLSDLRDKMFLDIGSGSGLHSLAAFDAGARCIHSFDFDENSVRTTRRLHELAGSSANWTVERGDVLDESYMAKLGKWNIVYSWGVLHHTGAMWRAVDSAAAAVAPGGTLFIALYSSNVAVPSVDFWLDVKRRYNAASTVERRRIELWYLWHFGLGRNPLRLPILLGKIYEKRKHRGMSYMTDVRDWLGGWPMEYADDQEVVDRLEQMHGFKLTRVATGEACTEFLFRNIEKPGRKTLVTELVANKGLMTGEPQTRADRG